MGWTNDDEREELKRKEEIRMKQLSKKILIAIIILAIIIIGILGVLIVNVNKTTYKVSIDGKDQSVKKSDLIIERNDEKYINIEKFASLVGYEFHNNEEYKSFTKELDKCYVKGKNETATFYVNDNKIYKSPIDDITSDYQEIKVVNDVVKIDGKTYASIEAVEIAFNVSLTMNEDNIEIYTLDYLVKIYDNRAKSKEWGYTGIADQEFENKKLILYGYLIVKKENGLYKIVDLKNKEEIVSDKYNDIKFVEFRREFIVTNSLNKTGIIDLNGNVKIEPQYDSLEIFDPQEETYKVSENNKYGIVKIGNKTVLPTEYDNIGIEPELYPNEKNRMYLLGELIPVCKNGRWGATDKNGIIKISIEYDGFGSSKVNNKEAIDPETGAPITVEHANENSTRNPVLTIKDCNGIVVRKNDKYGLIDSEGKLIVKIAADDMYYVKKAEGTYDYYMTYLVSEINLINLLIENNVIKPKETKTETQQEAPANTIQNTTTAGNTNVAGA